MTDLASIPLKTIDGQDASLADHAGKVLLVVNLASKCGLTPQYHGLQELYRDNATLGFSVLGFPSNDFAGQEPGSNAEIADFCSGVYNVSFPLFEKIHVAGEDKHPLYAALIEAQPTKLGDADGFRQRLKGFGMEPTQDPEVLWNFEKFVIAKDGAVVARFAPDTDPNDPALVALIEAELAK
jgi:glutathione peroxidase